MRPPTRRDLEVLAAMLTGTREDAARRLGVSVPTIRTHMTLLLLKLSVRDRVEAARALGWLRVPDEYLTGAEVPESSSQPAAPVATVMRVA